MAVSLVLVRYAELGLKSRPVRRRFEQVLVANMMAGLAKAGVEALVRSEQGRVFIETDKEREAVRAISRVFGVASLSVVTKADSDMESMGKVAAELSKPLLYEGQSFAVKARRVGDQAYTSMDVGREVGSAIFLANEEKKVRVDLTHPDVVFYVEVRGKVAYVFSTYVPGPGGLPLATQGRALALIEEEKDALAAWLIMKRGCRVIAVAEEENRAVEVLRSWDPELKVVAPGEWPALVKENRALAVVFGYTADEVERIKEVLLPVPAFFPLVGMSGDEIRERLKHITD
ncbi:MAG: THUMP domain-containing protein [Methanomassiliicoccales archaeon]|nr:THUMP domain-containing protein [Methanomassiliicoccales archaeon]